MPKFKLGKFQDKIDLRLKQMEEMQFVLRLWSKDASLWSENKVNKEISNSLGWLNVVEKMIAALPMLWKFEYEIKTSGFKHVVVLGMGGSSLSSSVFKKLVDPGSQGLPLTVIDTTDPDTILEAEKLLPLGNTLFILASKSGNTVEPLALFEYFYEKIKAIKGESAGENFVAITDSGTPLVSLASKYNFKHVFLNFSDVGGRYSIFTYFGIVPAILMGVNVGDLLERTLLMVHDCSAGVPIRKNSGVVLGAVIGELAKLGKNKLTFFVPDSVSVVKMWLEQLIAESTGKKGTGIIPVTGDINSGNTFYSNDRTFVFINYSGSFKQDWIEKINSLEQEGHPVIIIELDDILDFGKEFFRWQIATAISGAILEINPFDQPNVQENKANTEKILQNIESKGKVKEDKPLFNDRGLRYMGTTNGSITGEAFLDDFFSLGKAGDFISIQAYLPESPKVTNELEKLRKYLEENLHLATTYGFGPRYLHSTGQLHKGGINNGLFIILTGGNSTDVEIPGKPYTFGMLKNAQANGDFKALQEHNRRVIKIDIGEDLLKGINCLKETIKTSLALQLKFV
ncbi:MAG: glucose-6-phosphate isomerase [Bacteroidota bacterium]|nr:glucose-6-phosphate isomerase [Bacteroidota bacterium]